MRNAGLLILAAMIPACRSTPPKPVEIDPWDMCAYCRMAISQKQFAAEIIEMSGSVQKFDDIGCMLHYRRRQSGAAAATFVVDRKTRQWLHAESAYYVRSEKFQTPMGGGFGAFGSSDDAEGAARAFSSRVVRFSDLEAGGGM